MFVELLLFGIFEPKKHFRAWKFNQFYYAFCSVILFVGCVILATIDRLSFDLGLGLVGCLVLSIVLTLVSRKEIAMQRLEQFNNN